MTQPPNDDPRPPDIASSTLGRQTLVVEIICTKHAYVQDPPDLTLFKFMQDTESIPLVNLLWKI